MSNEIWEEIENSNGYMISNKGRENRQIRLWYLRMVAKDFLKER